MGNKEAAQEAIKDPNPVIDGRKANVNLAYLGAKPRSATLSNAAAAAAAASEFFYFLPNIALDKFLTKKFIFRYSFTFGSRLSNSTNIRVS